MSIMKSWLSSCSKTKHCPMDYGLTRWHSMRSRVPKASQTVRDSFCSLCQESHKGIKLHNYNIHAKCLGQSHTGSLAVGLVSVGPYESMLVFCVRNIVVSLTPLTPRLLSLTLSHNSRTPPNIWLWFSISVFISCWITWCLSDDIWASNQYTLQRWTVQDSYILLLGV